jgi:hypothetical protein
MNDVFADLNNWIKANKFHEILYYQQKLCQSKQRVCW